MDQISNSGPVAATSFDVADWFMERARQEDAHLPPRKLQYLLFLAQAHFAGAFKLRKLMPSVFILDHSGPIDPNTYRAFEHGRPVTTPTELPDVAQNFLDAIWRRYGAFDASRLNEIIAEQGEAEPAIQQRGAEIPMEAMARMFSRDAVRGVGKPKLMVSQSGRPVAVEKWQPGRKRAV